MARKKQIGQPKLSAETHITRNGNGGNARADQMVTDLANANVYWMYFMAQAAAKGCKAFADTLKKQNNPTVVGFNNGILQASVRGWLEAISSTYDSLPAAARLPIDQILATNPLNSK